MTLEEAAVAREYSFGSTRTAKVYPSKVDTVNSIIASFLRSECGVDAYYGQRAGSDYDFLWIYNVPFLFNIPGAERYVVFYPPLGSAGTISSTVNTSGNPTQTNLFYTDGVRYSFGLVFCGNPNTGFALRFKFMPSTSVSTNLVFRFMKCENIINGSDAVMWSSTNVYANGTTTLPSGSVGVSDIGGMNGIDLDGNGINKGSFSTEAIIYDPRLHTKTVHMASNEGALPLVPLLIGPYRANGIYLRPRGFSLPLAHSLGTEVQPEITIGGRSFLITNSSSQTIGKAWNKRRFSAAGRSPSPFRWMKARNVPSRGRS